MTVMTITVISLIWLQAVSRIFCTLHLAGRTQLGEFAPKFAHLAFEVPGENSSNEWLEPVTDEEYNKLK